MYENPIEMLIRCRTFLYILLCQMFRHFRHFSHDLKIFSFEDLFLLFEIIQLIVETIISSVHLADAFP